ncbi:Thiamine-phosphate synthase [Pseudovibrio axinellae]|uniref:Thiamine-phosphate synthase n=1 Tax=Pseudovibrio axinellae TaxID=989403 RepID=A0A165TWV3_9HYPH|nr:thiamine phosphate synthase [Pseudovibrio axinellae]KZL06741.1 Thiamine-phosphate synthase [Pseudovibrio axinellae]SER62556.1 thiamine-phosphate pyrophosphorylase [Pseudovibrio axinellae]
MLDRFYLIIDGTHWLPRVLPLGVKLVQLRIKDKSEDEIRSQVKAAKQLCDKAGAVLVVNDHWQAAYDANVGYVHLGQEDLKTADFRALRSAGIYYGVSTHDEAELDTALALDPQYVALGPIYNSATKELRWQPQGLETLKRWKSRTNKHLVAIGGITLERAPDVFAAGADTIATISDVTAASNPEQRVSQWLQTSKNW